MAKIDLKCPQLLLYFLDERMMTTFLGRSAGWLFLAEGTQSSRHCLTIVVRFSEDLSAVSRLQVAVILEDEALKIFFDFLEDLHTRLSPNNQTTT